MYYMTRGPHEGDELICKICGHTKAGHVYTGAEGAFCWDCAFNPDKTPTDVPYTFIEHDFARSLAPTE